MLMTTIIVLSVIIVIQTCLLCRPKKIIFTEPISFGQYEGYTTGDTVFFGADECILHDITASYSSLSNSVNIMFIVCPKDKEKAGYDGCGILPSELKDWPRMEQ